MSGGGPLGTWILPHNQLDLAKKQARIVGCPDDSSKNIFNCLKTIPAETLGGSLGDFRVTININNISFPSFR